MTPKQKESFSQDMKNIPLPEYKFDVPAPKYTEPKEIREKCAEFFRAISVFEDGSRPSFYPISIENRTELCLPFDNSDYDLLIENLIQKSLEKGHNLDWIFDKEHHEKP